MFWRNQGYVFILVFLLACNLQPYSQWPIKLTEDDILGHEDKIALITRNYVGKENSAKTLTAIARLYAEDENWPKALANVNRAIKLDPLNSNLHSLKADYAYQLGYTSVAYSEALTAYKLGVKSLRQSLGLARMAVSLSEFAMAGEIIDSLLLVYPDKPEVLYLAARKYDKHGDALKARACYQKVALLTPVNAENAFYYGRFLLNQNEPLNAQRVLEQAATGDNTWQYQQLLGDAYFLSGNYDAAAISYHRALASNTDTLLFDKLLDLYQNTGRADSLVRLSRAAVAAYPTNRTYLLVAARSLDKRYQYEEALTYYQKLYKLDTLDSMVAAEMSYLQRKIAYLQRKQQEQQQLADSLSKVLPAINF